MELLKHTASNHIMENGGKENELKVTIKAKQEKDWITRALL